MWVWIKSGERFEWTLGLESGTAPASGAGLGAFRTHSATSSVEGKLPDREGAITNMRSARFYKNVKKVLSCPWELLQGA